MKEYSHNVIEQDNKTRDDANSRNQPEEDPSSNLNPFENQKDSDRIVSREESHPSPPELLLEAEIDSKLNFGLDRNREEDQGPNEGQNLDQDRDRDQDRDWDWDRNQDRGEAKGEDQKNDRDVPQHTDSDLSGGPSAPPDQSYPRQKSNLKEPLGIVQEDPKGETKEDTSL